MSFICVCPEKSLEFGADEKLHRSAKEQFIRGVLESIQFPSGEKTILTKPGGGIAVQHDPHEMPMIADVTETSTLAALTGHIQNYAYLVKKYLQHELNLPPSVTLEALRERMPVSETELLCKLYAQMGTGMISKLRGHFSFCIYDATTVRVLAATDCSGSIPLLQGKLSDNSLFIASDDIYPKDAQEVEKIPAGHFKYGWHASASKFATAESEARHSAEEASNAANAALAGLFCRAADKAPQQRRSSFDSASLGQAHSPSSRRRSLDAAKNGRRSMDSAAAAKNRADNRSWWRSHEQRGNKTGHSQPSKTSKKTSKKSKRKQGTPPTATKAQSPAEEFINKLDEAIREDSASVRMLMNLLEDSPCSLAVTDADNKQLVFVNRSFEEQTGYKFDEVIGKSSNLLQAPLGGCTDPSSPGSKIMQHASKEGHCFSARVISYMKNGSPVLNECSVVPLRDAEGEVQHHVCMYTFEPLSEANSTAAYTQLRSSVLLRSRSCGDMASIASAPSAAARLSDGIAF